MSAGDPTPRDPWWASGRNPTEGLDGTEDPVDAHREARRGGTPPPEGDHPHDDGVDDDHATGPRGTDPARLASDAMDLVGRLAAEASRRVAARATANASGTGPGAFTRPDPETPADPVDDTAAGTRWRQLADGIAPHEDGRVCDACPVCIGLRALRQVRPEVIGHLSDAAHHLSLALRAFADAQAAPDEGLQKIDLDP